MNLWEEEWKNLEQEPIQRWVEQVYMVDTFIEVAQVNSLITYEVLQSGLIGGGDTGLRILRL